MWGLFTYRVGLCAGPFSLLVMSTPQIQILATLLPLCLVALCTEAYTTYSQTI